MQSLSGRLPGLGLVLGQKRYRHRHRPHANPCHRHPPSLSLATFAMAIEIGDEFVDFKASKASMADWSITGEHKFTFRFQKPDETRSIVLCAHADCSFCVYVTMNKEQHGR